MTQTQTTFPRTQHWTVDGFRVSVLLYKSHRNERCRTCGERGAIHAVWADRKSDGASGSPADFCDQHRPAPGTLPDLDYRIPTNWELPGIDNATFDKTWTEEAVRRAKDLADDLYAFLGDPSGRSCWLPGEPRTKAGELCSLLWELGLHLESTAGYDITGG